MIDLLTKQQTGSVSPPEKNVPTPPRARSEASDSGPHDDSGAWYYESDGTLENTESQHEILKVQNDFTGLSSQ